MKRFYVMDSSGNPLYWEADAAEDGGNEVRLTCMQVVTTLQLVQSSFNETFRSFSCPPNFQCVLENVRVSRQALLAGTLRAGRGLTVALPLARSTRTCCCSSFQTRATRRRSCAASSCLL